MSESVDLWPAGRVLGGSSAINGMLFVRGAREDFDGWAALGNRGWSFDDVLPAFRSIENSAVDIDGSRGHGGPMQVSRLRTTHPLGEVFLQAAAELGVRLNDDYNGLEQEGVARPEIERRVREMLEIVKLGEFGKRKPHQLSGGQRQRVALARALVKKPKLLLLDEPLGALDKKLREHTQFELINLQEQLGVTFVVVTHDQEEAMTLASRIGVMNKGQIVQVGTPTEIYEFPNSRFVADFIGSVNMFEGRLVEDEPGHVRIRCDDLDSTVFVSHGISAAPDARVFVAIRPEKIEITRGPTAEGENCVGGVVREIAYMGDMSVYLVRLDSGRTVRVTIPNIERHEERIVWDERVVLRWQPSSPVVLTQ